MNKIFLFAVMVFLSFSVQAHAYTWNTPEVWTAPFLVEIWESYAGLRMGYNITPTVPIRLDNLTLGRFSQSVGIYVFRMSDGSCVVFVPVYNSSQQSVNFTSDVILYPNDSYYITSAPSPYSTYSDIDPSYYPNVTDGFVVNDAVYTPDYGVTWIPAISQAYDIQSIAYERYSGGSPSDGNLTVRFWTDLNMTEHYYNEFLWVYAKKACEWWQKWLFQCSDDTYYHAAYVGGSAVINIEKGYSYDLYALQGAVHWNNTGAPNVTSYDIWQMFDTVHVSGDETLDYFWNTTTSGKYPLFGDYDLDFWSSVAGIIILFVVVIAVAYFTDNGVAVLLSMVLMYILLKLFGILTGAIFFGFF